MTAAADPSARSSTEGTDLPAGARVLVTGATGFIGGRLVERLVAAGAAEIRCPVRHRKAVAALGRGPVQAVKAELDDPDLMPQLVAGSDYLFHCAYDIADPRRNIAILRTLIDACAGSTLRRFVLVSSFSVYQPFPAGLLTEQAADGDRTNPYVDVKLTLEDMVLSATRAGRLSGTVIQPAIVYGPGEGGWTRLAAERLRTGEVVLPDGDGLCNPVHVDDVVESMLLAAVQPGAIGERFIVSGPETITWSEYHHRLALEIGAQPPVLASAETIASDISRAESAPAPSRPQRAVQRVLRAGRVRRLLARVPGLAPLAAALGRWAGLPPRQRHLPEWPILELYLAKATASCAKAGAALGYRPRISFDQGMRQTGAWLRGEELP